MSGSNTGFESILDMISDALLVVNNSGEVLWANEGSLPLLGYKPQELVGSSINCLIPKRYLEAHGVLFKNFFLHPAKRPMGYSKSLNACNKEGQNVTVTIELSPIDWDNGECVLANIRKASEHPSLDDTFKDMKKLFDESQSIANLGAWEWDITTDEILWSNQIFAIFGVDSQTIKPTYELFLSFVHPGDRQMLNNAVSNSLSDDLPYQVQHRIIRGDGSVGYVVERGKVYRDRQGKPIRMIGTVHDVTSEYNHQMQLKLAESVFKYSYDGAISTDKGLNVIKVNPAFERMSGYQTEHLEGRSLCSVFLDFDVSYILPKVNKNGFWRGSVNCRKNNKDCFPAHLSIAKIEDEMGPGTKYYVVTITDISSLKLHEKQLKKLAYYDSLTSLFNRSYFIEKASEEIQLCNNRQNSLSLLFVDLDGFKEINDTQGHAEGDRVLIHIAHLLTEAIGNNGLLSRFGGDEFVVLHRCETDGEVQVLASKIINALSFSRHYGAYTYKITASIGISCYPKDAESADDLIKKADIAMYKAKEAGKNCFLFYQESYIEEKAHRRQLISDLERGLSQQQITSYFQPIISVRNSKLKYFEALVRWEHPNEGLVAPCEFIPIAEETGLIVELGDTVLKQACEFLTILHKQGEAMVAVNLSVVQLFEPSLLERIKSIVGTDPKLYKSLVFEVTESAAMQNLQIAKQVLTEIKKLGSSIAIDDFGTGYSSLSHLSELPVDIVKIDRSFVRFLPDNHEDILICKAIISLSHSLKMTVVAEGIETKDQYQLLKDMDCDYMQGYLLGRPVRYQELL